LLDTRECIRKVRRYMYASVVDAVCSYSLLFALLYLMKKQRVRHKAFAALWSVGLLRKAAERVAFVYAPMRTTFFARFVVGVAGLSAKGVFVYTCLRFATRVMRRWRMNKLKKCHKQLFLLLRMWHIVLETIQESRARRDRHNSLVITSTTAGGARRRAAVADRVRSYSSLVSMPARTDYHDALKTESRLLLESVPMPSSTHLFTWTRGRMKYLRLFIDLGVSSYGTAWNLSGHRPLLAMAIVPFTVPYFLWRPGRSANYANGTRSLATWQFARFAGGLFASRAFREVMLRVAAVPFEMGWRASVNHVLTHRLNVGMCTHESVVCGTKVMVLSTRALPANTSVQSSLVPPLPARLRSFLRANDFVSDAAMDESAELDAPCDAAFDGDADAPPVVLFIQGGGFLLSLLEMDFAWIARLTRHSGAVVVTCDYGLSPDFPYPHALNQIEVTYRWIRAGGLGFVPPRVIVVGESAGGNLATCLCVRVIMSNRNRRVMPPNEDDDDADAYGVNDESDESEDDDDNDDDIGGDVHMKNCFDGAAASPINSNAYGNYRHLCDGSLAPAVVSVPNGCVLAYPAINLALSPSPSRTLHISDPLLGGSVLSECVRCYAMGHKQQRITRSIVTDPQMSPCYASRSTLACMPPTAIVVGGHDPLLDDAVDFFIQLRRAGVSAKLKVYRTLPHGFMAMESLLPEARKACTLAMHWVSHLCADTGAQHEARAGDDGNRSRSLMMYGDDDGVDEGHDDGDVSDAGSLVLTDGDEDVLRRMSIDLPAGVTVVNDGTGDSEPSIV
jgi:acetyl esterase/lipase